MSLFGSSMMGFMDDFPLFESHMQYMNNMNGMINPMFSDPFGMMGPPALTDGRQMSRSRGPEMQMMPFGFPPMPDVGRLFAGIENMTRNPNYHSFSSSSFMSMTSGSDGRPQVYQESTSTTVAPGGVKETKKTVCDSRTGVKKMAIGHHIGERAHVIAREQNLHNGDREEHQEFINLEEEEAESFNKEWETRTRHGMGPRAIGPGNYRPQNYHRGPDDRQLALPSTAPSIQQSSQSRPKKKATRFAAAPKAGSSSKRSCESSVSDVNTHSPPVVSAGARKREHTPDTNNSNKRHVASSNDK